MRSFLPSALLVALVASALGTACSSSTSSGFGMVDSGTPVFNPGSGTGTSTGTGPHLTVDSGMLTTSDSGGGTGSGSGGSTVTTIYADTDTALYSLDPMTNQVTMIGSFTGFAGGDTGVTDLAVNAEGDVYVNSESIVYKATLPAGGTGSVALTMIATIALSTANGKTNSFYALGFAPAGVLGAGETLVGGDNTGELWSIDPVSGATKDLGNFGSNPSDSGYILGCSGDIVFYLNASGQPTGLATIRSCKPGGTNCTTKDDYLAGIDMTALANAYTSGTPATSLLAGVYGGGASSVGPGTSFGDLFGLGAWEGKVFGFGHSSGDLITIDSYGAGTLVSSMSGTEWAGAGVSTRTTITVAPPPAAAK
jgi:hypothetical protein